MPPKYSVKETKEFLDFILVLTRSIKNILKDGKLDLFDLTEIAIVMPSAIKAFDSIDMIPKELADFDEADSKEILEHVSGKLGEAIPNEELKTKIEKALKLGLSLAELIAVL